MGLLVCFVRLLVWVGLCFSVVTYMAYCHFLLSKMAACFTRIACWHGVPVLINDVGWCAFFALPCVSMGSLLCQGMPSSSCLVWSGGGMPLAVCIAELMHSLTGQKREKRNGMESVVHFGHRATQPVHYRFRSRHGGVYRALCLAAHEIGCPGPGSTGERRSALSCVLVNRLEIFGSIRRRAISSHVG